MTELHDPVLVFPQLIFEGRYLALADIDGVVDFKKYRLRLLLVLLLELQVGDELLSVLMLSVQVERHVVHRLRPRVTALDAVIDQEIRSVDNSLLRDAVQRRYEGLDLYVAELVATQAAECFRGCVLQQYGGVDPHLIVPDFLVLDSLELLECLGVLLLVDVVHNQLLVASGLLREVDALLDVAMRLQHLEDRVGVEVGLVLGDKLAEVHL